MHRDAVRGNRCNQPAPPGVDEFSNVERLSLSTLCDLKPRIHVRPFELPDIRRARSYAPGAGDGLGLRIPSLRCGLLLVRQFTLERIVASTKWRIRQSANDKVYMGVLHLRVVGAASNVRLDSIARHDKQIMSRYCGNSVFVDIAAFTIPFELHHLL